MPIDVQATSCRYRVSVHEFGDGIRVKIEPGDNYAQFGTMKTESSFTSGCVEFGLVSVRLLPHLLPHLHPTYYSVGIVDGERLLVAAAPATTKNIEKFNEIIEFFNDSCFSPEELKLSLEYYTHTEQQKRRQSYGNTSPT